MAQMAKWGVGVCLADDMGLGKTIQGLAVLLSRMNEGPALIVAPTSVITNWEREAKRFTPDLKVLKIQALGSGNGGARAKRHTIIEKAKAGDLLITSYGLMMQEIKYFRQKRFATIILDESQAIKNPSSHRAAAAKMLQGDFRIAMSGTPIENRLTELWSLFQFLNPGLLPSRRTFDDRFTIPIQKNGDNDAKTILRRLVQPFILRRTKGEVLKELPARTEIALEVELSPEERTIYEAVREESLNALINTANSVSTGPDQLDLLSAFTKLRQICCNTKLLNANSPIESAKMETFLSVMEDLRTNHHKTLVFSQFVKHLQLVVQELEERKIPYQYLDGSSSAVERQRAIDAFHTGEGDFFLISLKAGGVGLNLTAADYVIHLDPWWNPAVEDQATDRAHRIGQTKPVTVYRLITTGTIEEKIVDLHHKKRDLAQKILDGTDQTASFSREELLNILRG